MKILILQDYLRSGGTERQSVLLGAGFTAAGHETTLLTFRPGGPLSTSLHPVEHRALQWFDLGLDWFAPGLQRTVRKECPQIVLAMGRIANCYAGPLQRWLDRQGRRSAVVGTLRTGKQLPWLFRQSLRLERHVVANSAETRALVAAQENLPPEKITVIYNSLVFPAGLEDSRADQRRQLGAAPGAVVLLSVAMFRPEKNQRELIETVAGLPATTPWQLWLVGDGQSRADCERIVREQGLSERVKFLGYVADPSALYRAADIAVHASRSESLSNFLIEAQAHGLPVVAYEAQGIRECFLEEDTGWAIPQGDRSGFQRALAPLFSETPATRAARGERARQFARGQFDPARQVQAYLDLFARLISP